MRVELSLVALGATFLVASSAIADDNCIHKAVTQYLPGGEAVVGVSVDCEDPDGVSPDPAEELKALCLFATASSPSRDARSTCEDAVEGHLKARSRSKLRAAIQRGLSDTELQKELGVSESSIKDARNSIVQRAMPIDGTDATVELVRKPSTTE